MSHAYVFGLVGPVCDGSARQVWNALLRERHIDGFFDFYRTVTIGDLELRLSEMFRLGRVGYIVHPSLSRQAIPLMDHTDRGVAERGVRVVKNAGGVLTGYGYDFSDNDAILNLWMVQ